MGSGSRRPKVSVIVPVYNTGKYLAACVQSLQMQTYRELEILLVDDGSEDDSAAICAELQMADTRVRFFRQSHRGVSAARNRALDACTGEYILFVDSDDLLHPALIEQYVLCMQKSTAVYIHCAYTRFITPPKLTERAREYPRPIPLSPERTLALLRRGRLRGIGGKCFRARCLAGLRFDERLHYNEDTAFLWQVYLKGGQALFYNAPWYYYRQHPNSACASFDGDSRANLAFLEEMRAYEYANAGTSPSAAYYACQWEGKLLRGLLESYCNAGEPEERAQRDKQRMAILTEMRHPLFAQLPFQLRAAAHLCLGSRAAYKAARKGLLLCRRMRRMPAYAHIGLAPVCSVRQNGAGRRIALTFETDFGADSIDAILAALKRHAAAATFFVSGMWVEAFPEKAALLAKSGCELMSLSDTCPSFTQCSAEDIRDELKTANRKIAAVTGLTPALVRCPGGAYDDRVLQCIRGAGMQAVQWSVDSGDGLETATAADIYARVLKRTAPGDIIRCHASGRYTPRVLERILSALEAKGYRPVTVSELISAGSNDMRGQAPAKDGSQKSADYF